MYRVAEVAAEKMDLLGATLRANPGYEFLPRRDRGGGVGNIPADFYGLLQPRPGGALRPRLVCAETALLFLTLREPGTIPAATAQAFSLDAVWRLVLDGILEVERGDGEFVSGADATALGPRASASVTSHPIAALSKQALEEAAEIEGGEAEVADFLYGYHRVPLSARWKARLPDRASVFSFLGLADPIRRRLLERHWIGVDDAQPTGWISWRARAAASIESESARFKLYVSPALDDFPEVFAAVLDCLPSHATHFKIGADACGLLRPDKCVAYFSSLDGLHRCAQAVHESCGTVRVQGVPFTAPVDDDGLLTWGMDPPPQPQRSSWRQWITQRLATFLVDARASRAANACEFALERLRHEHVDPETFTPSSQIWSNG
ncbi:MAG TPA: hypothetical protein VFP10_14085 [Candidatus Eisenbacteria bacterium]|nr:hypothetical protein [Candidatus Eisenbacteria bacterium]